MNDRERMTFPLPPPYHPSSLSLDWWQRLQLSLFGRVYVGHYFRSEWSRPIAHYLFYCEVHGATVDYHHGFSGKLHCVTCRKGEDESTIK